MIERPQYTEEELQKDRQHAIAVFRRERLDEPLEAYLEAFDKYQGVFEDLLETTVDLSNLRGEGLQVLSDQTLVEAFRYLAGPPISTDDLKIVADTVSLNRNGLAQNEELVQRIVDLLLRALDRRRFPWVTENREPTEAERTAAVVASAALVATQRLGTARRHKGKRAQELRVEDALLSAGFRKVPTRRVESLPQAPGLGEFCGECHLGNRKADFIVRLWDQRVMPVECKVSNSSTNSVKRLNNDAAAKAAEWLKKFGTTQIVPVAVITGVFKLHNLIQAQESGLSIFWAHNLKEMIDWIEATR